MKLRDYQLDIIDQTRALMKRGERSILICSPTGSGKTALTAHMLGTAASRGHSSWFNVHRRELIKQSMMAFDNIGVRHGVIASSFMPDSVAPVQVASIGTLRNRHHRYKKPTLIIWDECHHLGAKTWEKIYDAYPDSFHIGLTATPVRLDGKGLDKYFSNMIKGPSVSDLIEMGYLSDYKLFAPASPNLSGVHKRMGDYIKSELLQVMDKPTITGSAINEYMKRAAGKRGVVFAVSIEHSKNIVAQFNARGISAEHVDGGTDKGERDASIARFKSGETKILSNVEIFTEGFDLPAMECVILLRPTQSLGMYLQMVGRVLRPSPGKTHAIILDHASNAATHGLPDEDREWSLKGIERRTKKSDDGPSIKICASCFAAQLPGSTTCRICGYSFPLKPRTVDEVDGDLVEIDPKILREKRRAEQRNAQTLEELTAIGKQRGFKHARRWAQHVFQARQRKKLGG